MKTGTLLALIVVLALLILTAGLLLMLPGKDEAEDQPMDMGAPASMDAPVEETSGDAEATPDTTLSPIPNEPEASPAAQTETPAQPAATQASPKPSPSPTPKSKPLSGVIIGLDPGHQAHSNSDLEPVAPGSSDMKAKVSSGTYGRFTGVREHEVNLRVGLLLRDLLKEAGATVVMTRTTADVDISNAERAQLFNKKEVELGVRLHCNGSDDPNVAGAFMLVPTKSPYKDECVEAAEIVLAAYGKATDISIKKGLTYRGDQTGFNWCERPVINIEMGHMTNEEEDYKLTDSDFQKKMAKGIYNGILEYFEQKGD